MATFTPPTDNFVYWADQFQEGILSHLRPGPRGRNVYKLTDGTYTEWQPAFQEDIEIIYHGGHIHTLSEDEVASLTAAGYGDYITP